VTRSLLKTIKFLVKLTNKAQMFHFRTNPFDSVTTSSVRWPCKKALEYIASTRSNLTIVGISND
jgi:hypothetical protein